MANNLAYTIENSSKLNKSINLTFLIQRTCNLTSIFVSKHILPMQENKDIGQTHFLSLLSHDLLSLSSARKKEHNGTIT